VAWAKPATVIGVIAASVPPAITTSASATVARALAAGISRPALAPIVEKHLDLLFRQSERYLRRLTRERGWRLDRAPAAEARTFWSAALGAVLLARAGAADTAADLDLAGTLTIRDA